jgi:TRAP-type C4-dicarboxylate transport system permease small subunit
MKAVEFLLAALLLGMVVMVFGNVVLRYAFNSGIDVSEELSRYFFVWLTFIGAIVAMHEGSHLGMDTFVAKLGRHGKIACLVVCQGLILLCCSMLVWGTWRQHEVNATTMAPVTGLSMIWVYGVGYLTGGAIALHAVQKLWRIATGRIADEELIEISESEEMPHPAQEARA